MPKAKAAAGEGGRRYVRIDCPGCGDHHMLPVEGASPVWSFNGDYDRPTITPSILARSGHFVPNRAGDGCWCTLRESGEDWGFDCYICHSFVTDGRIQFLSDCSHALAGQTVDLREIAIEAAA